MSSAACCGLLWLLSVCLGVVSGCRTFARFSWSCSAQYSGCLRLKMKKIRVNLILLNLLQAREIIKWHWIRPGRNHGKNGDGPRPSADRELFAGEELAISWWAPLALAASPESHVSCACVRLCELGYGERWGPWRPCCCGGTCRRGRPGVTQARYFASVFVDRDL